MTTPDTGERDTQLSAEYARGRLRNNIPLLIDALPRRSASTT